MRKKNTKDELLDIHFFTRFLVEVKRSALLFFADVTYGLVFIYTTNATIFNECYNATRLHYSVIVINKY